MGRKSVKPVPPHIQEFLDYANLSTDQLFLMSLTAFLRNGWAWIPSTMLCIPPNRDYVMATPVYSQMERLVGFRRDEIERILFCEGCRRFVWKRKLDSVSCGDRNCVDHLNNARRRRVRSETIDKSRPAHDK